MFTECSWQLCSSVYSAENWPLTHNEINKFFFNLSVHYFWVNMSMTNLRMWEKGINNWLRSRVLYLLNLFISTVTYFQSTWDASFWYAIKPELRKPVQEFDSFVLDKYFVSNLFSLFLLLLPLYFVNARALFTVPKILKLYFLSMICSNWHSTVLCLLKFLHCIYISVFTSQKPFLYFVLKQYFFYFT